MKTFDVLIVGGGVIGTSIAFQLSAEKLRVLVLDRQQPGQEASWAAAGMLSPAPDTPRDIALVPLAKASFGLYPQFIAAIEAASGLSAAHRDSGTMEVFLGPGGEAERNEMVNEHRRLGLAAQPISPDDARKLEKALGPNVTAAALLPGEGSVEPRLLMNALLTAARNRGVEIRSGAPVRSLLLDESRRCTGVLCAGEQIRAKVVVIAAGCFSAQMLDELAYYAPTRPIRGQMLALRTKNVEIDHIVRSRRGYLVPRRDGRIVAGSTIEEDGFEKRVTPAGLRKIIDSAVELVPSLADADILETWSGLRPGTADDLPVIGPTDVDGLMVATGHYRNGILLAPITAKLVVEWILNGQVSFDAGAFSPLRFAVRPRERKIMPSSQAI